ncbi:MAG: hypothetical protein JXL80_10320 [Planctomycetes bacterium]|nr:hypothetical protein [Planctomycetota bacterium]
MAELLTCTCGQALDVSDYTPGQQVRCPACQEVLTVPGRSAPPPAAPPPMAMAVAVDDEPSGTRPAAAQTRPRDPMARRRMAERRSANVAQTKLKKVMIWPCLVLGLASMGVGALGLSQLFAPKVIELETTVDPASGVKISHMYARVPKTPEATEYERVEVQPDIYPGDWTNGDDFTLNGVKPTLRSGAWIINYENKEMAVERRGYWFYEVDLAAAPVPVVAAPVDNEAIRNETVETPDETATATTKPQRRLLREVDLPLVAMTRVGRGEDALYTYKLVKWQGEGFVDPSNGKPITTVSYYRVTKSGIQDVPIEGDFEKHEVPALMKLASPMFFIVSGPLVGLLLLAGAVFFAWEAYFSQAAKDRRRQEAAQRDALKAS